MRAVQPVAMQVMWWPQLRLWQIVHIAYLQRERTPGAHLGGRTALRDDAFRALFTCQLAHTQQHIDLRQVEVLPTLNPLTLVVQIFCQRHHQNLLPDEPDTAGCWLFPQLLACMQL
jgi:hypothetical protein